MMAFRKLIGWIIVVLAGWMMSKWVYRNSNRIYCEEKGKPYDAAGDSCLAPDPAAKP